MNFLSPPTDNLYKFVALSGLIIIFSAIYFPTKMVEDISIRVTDLKLESEISQANIEFVSKKVENYRNAVDTYVDDKTEIKGWKPDIEQLRKELDPLILERKVAIAKLEASQTKLVYLQNKADEAIWGGIIANIIGLLMVFFGFHSWYTKVQTKIDRELELRVSELEK